MIQEGGENGRVNPKFLVVAIVHGDSICCMLLSWLFSSASSLGIGELWQSQLHLLLKISASCGSCGGELDRGREEALGNLLEERTAFDE